MPGRRDGLHASTLVVTTWSLAAVGRASSTALRPDISPRDTSVVELGHELVDLDPGVIDADVGDELEGLHRHHFRPDRRAPDQGYRPGMPNS